ncbi:FAD-dependent oxidoreductase [Microcoleus sp. Pol7_A1]|uniref:FAD-dependent oxidoreductase n=1 Tax=Microcoleus sp. Pol7_A1 TaxID=2818893 RepID=UPI002FCF0CE8
MSESKEPTTKIVKEIPTPDTILDVQQTTCCIVGGGPTGAVLALILARQGIPVMLLEAHKTFERDFRGDVVHGGGMELLEQLGLTDRLLEQIPHSKAKAIQYIIDGKTIPFVDWSGLKGTRYPYMTIISQVQLIQFLTAEAKRYPNFQLLMGANVQQLIEEDGIIRGVRYRGSGGWHEVRSHLTVGADGRFSPVRKLAGMELMETAAPLDVFWFRLPRHADEPEGLFVRLGNKRFLVTYNTYDGNWQIGYYILKGQYREIQAAGIEALRQSIVEVVPEWADRVQHLENWKDVSFLSIKVGRLDRWYREGLLLIGDAAHVMLPMGGIGINYGIQDAVVAANILIEPLKRGEVQLNHLAAVQRQRQWQIQFIQELQYFMQRQVSVKALQSGYAFKLPIYWGLPLWRDFIARQLAFGVLPPNVKLAYRL